jgi:uncharacterized membrane protein YeaQ/YmgE (transglycosylase-associated protein family)
LAFYESKGILTRHWQSSTIHHSAIANRPSAIANLLGVFMTIFDLIVLLVVAGVCGALGQAITGFSRGGCLVSIALGFVGAVLGVWIARNLGLPELFNLQIGTTTFPIVWSIIGSAVFVAVIALLTRRRD